MKKQSSQPSNVRTIDATGTAVLLDQALGHTYQYWMNTAGPVASQNWNSLFLSRDSLSDGSRRFRKTTAKSDYLLRHAYLSRLSVCPHRITRIPLDRFSWNFILAIFTNVVYQIQVSLKSHNVRGTLHEELRTFIITFYNGDRLSPLWVTISGRGNSWRPTKNILRQSSR
jgi:hypothetical protein